MSETEQSEISHALDRTRRRWLTSAMVNAGGRWAVLPATGVAFAGMLAGLLLQPQWPWLLLLATLGVAGMGVALLLTRRAYTKDGSPGAPDYALLLDKALGLGDALPAYLEGSGKFQQPLANRIARALDPQKEKAAAPRRHFAPLFVALMLALFPLVFAKLDPRADSADQTAKTPPETEQPADSPENQPSTQGGGEPTEGTPDQPGEGEGGGDGGEGDVAGKPDGNTPEGGGGDSPDNAKPKNDGPPEAPAGGGSGDKKGEPEKPPATQEPDIKTNIDKVKPEAGKGDTTTKERSRWVYNPDGAPLDGSTPSVPEMKHPGERAVSRTKVTTREKKLIDDLHRELYE